MIAKVVPAIRIPNAGPFDYLIPEGAEAPSPGSLAIVRFRGKKVPGLVMGISETSEVDMSRLKPLETVLLGGEALYGPETLSLLPSLAAHYGVPLPLLLLSLLPTLPAKPQDIRISVRGAADHDARRSAVQLESAFDAERSLAAIAETRDDGPLLVLSPTVNHSDWLVHALSGAGVRVSSYHGTMKPKDAWTVWTSLVSGTADVLVVTRAGILAPLPASAGVAIFAEEEPSFVQFDAEPRYDARFLARARCRAERRRLTSISEAPTVAAYADAGDRRLLENLGAVTIVKLDDERKSGFKGVFSDAALEAARASLSEGKDVAVCVNRKGTALSVRCADCFASVSCGSCGSPMRAFGRVLRCVRCGTESAIPALCPSCGGARLRDRGLTAETAISELRRLLPGEEIVAFESGADARAPTPAVFVGTEIMVHSLRPALERRRIGTVVVPYAEQLLGLGDYSDSEEAYALLRALQAVASRQGGSLILQTYLHDNPAIQSLDWDPKPFYDSLLQEREEFGYPPAWTYVKILTPRDLMAEKASETLRNLLPPGARIDFSGENAYICRFKPGDSPLPPGFSTLGPGWSWRANPRYAQD